MAKVARKQVNAEKKRLEEARNIANSEKRLYVKVAIFFFLFLLLFCLFCLFSIFVNYYFQRFFNLKAILYVAKITQNTVFELLQ